MDNIKKLTNKQVEELRKFKGQKNGSEKFFNYIEELYKDNSEVMKEIERCRQMSKAADEVGDLLPTAQSKATHMFYEWMDDLNEMIGYTAN